MSAVQIVRNINSFFSPVNDLARSTLRNMGVSPDKVGSTIDTIGLFTCALITVMILTAVILGYIQRSHAHEYNSFNDGIVKSKVSSIVGIMSLFSAIFFLFAIIYIYFNK